MKTIFVSFAISTMLLYQPAKADSVATIECTPTMNKFVVRSIPDGDEGQPAEDIAEFPTQCKVGGSVFRAKVKRAPYGFRLCGAQPVLSIWVYRANKPIIADAAFGFNCQAGPAISLIEVIAKAGQVPMLRLCVLREGRDTDDSTVCKSIRFSSRVKPINQTILDEIVEQTSP